MVNFQQTPKPRNYLSRREQRRLLLMVMALGLLVVMMIEAGKPERWQWFAALDGGAEGTAEEQTPVAGAPVDTRAPPPDDDREIRGTFRLQAPVAEQPEADTTGRFFPGVVPDYLEQVRDDKLFRSEENRAWRNLLEVLNGADQPTLKKASTGRVTFAQLFSQSREYRGELVTVRGTVRRAHRIAAPEAENLPEKYYKLWLFPDDFPDSPMMIYCLYVPKGFPTGMTLQPAEITGFHFKRCVYNAKDSFRRAPLLVARTLDWRKAEIPATTDRPLPGLGSVFAVIGVAAAFCLFVTVYVFTRTRITRRSEPETPPKFDILQE